jgi:predicted metal-dependent HD superfamily phosphohydrolase
VAHGGGTAAGRRAIRYDLRSRYGEPPRAYHTLRHIAEWLAHFTPARARARDADLVEFALWAHDVIYDPRRDDNERRSAEWAQRALLDGGLPRARAKEAHALVTATAHLAPPVEGDAQLTCDVDLAILGAPQERFEAYEREIRREYSWVPEPVFRTRRAEILERFLARPYLYGTAWFRELHEAQARSNLERSLAELRASEPGD